MNGEPGAISSTSGGFRDVVPESFDEVGRNTAPTVDYRLDDAYDDYPSEIPYMISKLTCASNLSLYLRPGQ
jgi:hypothetical protein